MRFVLSLLLAIGLFATPALAETPVHAIKVTATPPSCDVQYAPDLSTHGLSPADLANAKADTPLAVAACVKTYATERSVAAILAFILITIAIGVFAMRSEILRDSDPVDFPSVTVAGHAYPAFKGSRAFSLSQSQMMWWFWIVIASAVYMAIKYCEIDGGLNQEALILLTIGAGTAAGSAVIDQSRPNKGNAVTQFNDAMKAMLDAASPPANRAAADALYAKMLASNEALKSDGFVADVVSDANGVSIHRFQALAWNAVLGVTYLVNVFAPEVGQQVSHATPWFYTLPVLTSIQLGLLGISNGAYLGLKIPEATPGTAPPPPAPVQP